MPAAWEEEIGRQEGNRPLERALTDERGQNGGSESERKKRWRRGDACAPNSGGTSRNEMHGNIHVYIQEHERDAERS